MRKREILLLIKNRINNDIFYHIKLKIFYSQRHKYCIYVNINTYDFIIFSFYKKHMIVERKKENFENETRK